VADIAAWTTIGRGLLGNGPSETNSDTFQPAPSLSRANSPQRQPDLGCRLETLVALHLRRRARSPVAASRLAVAWAGERDLWECDFVTADEAIQVCFEVTPSNHARELTGALEAARLPGRRRPCIVTFDQSDRLREDGVEVEIVPAWRWLSER